MTVGYLHIATWRLAGPLAKRSTVFNWKLIWKLCSYWRIDLAKVSSRLNNTGPRTPWHVSLVLFKTNYFNTCRINVPIIYYLILKLWEDLYQHHSSNINKVYGLQICVCLMSSRKTLLTTFSSNTSLVGGDLHKNPDTVKPVYNDHLFGYFFAFWSSSWWPRATYMSSRRKKLLARFNWYHQSSLKHTTE